MGNATNSIGFSNHRYVGGNRGGLLFVDQLMSQSGYDVFPALNLEATRLHYYDFHCSFASYTGAARLSLTDHATAEGTVFTPRSKTPFVMLSEVGESCSQACSRFSRSCDADRLASVVSETTVQALYAEAFVGAVCSDWRQNHRPFGIFPYVNIHSSGFTAERFL